MRSAVENKGFSRQVLPCLQAAVHLRQPPLAYLAVAVRIGMHRLSFDAVAQEVGIEIEKDVEQFIDAPGAAEKLVQILWPDRSGLYGGFAYHTTEETRL